ITDEVVQFEFDCSDLNKPDSSISQEISVKGVPWKVFFLIDGDIRIGFMCDHNQFTPWKISIAAEFNLLHPDEAKDISVKNFHKAKDCSVLELSLINKEDFKNNIKNFIHDNKITIEVRLLITKMKGIKIAHEFDFFNPNEPFNDVALVIEGEKIYASKQILAASSPVFKAMFY
ncbi:hypothetical protein PMAYCL1PPCAC_25206, partial [Pristionchus mayeri]